MNASRPRILHVDDELSYLKAVKLYLHEKGMEVTSAATAGAALDEVGRRDFDLILLDIMMPDMSGWELFTRITEIKPQQRVAFLTVLNAADGRIQQLKDRGMVDYIPKALNIDEFLKRVKNILAK